MQQAFGRLWSGPGILYLGLAFAIGCDDPSPPTQIAPAPVLGEREATLVTDKLTDDLPKPEAVAVISDRKPTDSVAALHESAPPNADRFRSADDRPPWDESQLAAAGIRVYRSKRLILLSDCPAEQVQLLPAIADELYQALESRVGKLWPAADGSEFQLTGCVMDAEERFRTCDLLPEIEFQIRHGRHLNYRFWMRNPSTDYYRRHLLLHEFTHCYLSCEYGMSDIPPLWYTEGIAEYFATHVPGIGAGQAMQFGIMPESIDAFRGWGRISEIQRSFSTQPIRSSEPVPDAQAAQWDAGFTALSAVLAPKSRLFIQDSQYAHAWALCWLLHNHPDLAANQAEFDVVRTAEQFQTAFARIDPAVLQKLAVDWLLFQDSVIEGFDVLRSFPSRTVALHSTKLAASEVRELEIAAAAGWQSTGILCSADSRLQIEAKGRFTVRNTTTAWPSEPQGITIEYHRGRPVGELIGMLVAPDGSRASRRFPIATLATFRAPFEAELWLQLNESAAGRSDNDGVVRVTVTQLAE